MKTAATWRSEKARRGFIRGQWLARVHPAFVNYWISVKKNRSLAKNKNQKDSDATFRKWLKDHGAAQRALDQAIKELANPIAPKIQLAVLDIEGLAAIPVHSTLNAHEGIAIYAQNPESSGVFRKLVFLKYGITFPELMERIELTKQAGAYRKLNAIHRDYSRLLLGARLEDLKLKFNWDHFDLITQGIDFGLDRLTPYELADCLDEICPCCRRHSPEYLKKLRIRITQACSRLG